MNAVNTSCSLLTLPEAWSTENTTSFIMKAKLSTPIHRSLEPVGPHFLAHARRKRHHRTFSEDDRIIAAQQAKNVEDVDSGDMSEPEDALLLSRDPKDWKKQDHYAVLGLSKYRWKSTDEQIKKAHRKKVLKHHPDKKAAAGAVDDDNFFKCIQKAMEILTDPIKRRQYDSVDEFADIHPPSKKAKGNIYKLWGPVFRSEGRFSKIQPVPSFGDDKSTKEEVEEFYNFWYNFDSWRTFEYLDEDVPDDNENRDQKRFVERKNKAQRAKKKTEDTARLRKIVDDALEVDQRMKRFRQQERLARDAKKIAREAEEKKAAEEAKVRAAEEAKRKEEEETLLKAKKLDSKKSKEAAKNAIKKNKRTLRKSVEDSNYFQGAGKEVSASTITSVLAEVEVVIAKIDSERLDSAAKDLGNANDSDTKKSIWARVVKELVGAGLINESDVTFLLS